MRNKLDSGLLLIKRNALLRFANKHVGNESLLTQAFDRFQLFVNECQVQHPMFSHADSDYRDVLNKRWRRHYQQHAWFQESLDNARSAAKIAESCDSAVMFALFVSRMKADLDSFGIRGFRRLINSVSNKEDGDTGIEILEDRNVISRCDDCDEYELAGQQQDVGSEQVCRSCIESNYSWSDCEDQYVHYDYSRSGIDESGNEVIFTEGNSDFVWDDDEDTYVHFEYSGSKSNLLKSYHSSKGSFRLIDSPWTRMNRIFMGCELEVEVVSGGVREKLESLHPVLNEGQHLGHRAFFEEDGSLDYGFEIITQPMGLDSHQNFWGWLNKRDLRKNMKSHNTSSCGFHVHLSRKGLTQLQINKMISFINHPNNEKLIRAIARRYGQHYSRMKQKKLGSAHKTDDRYEAVNVLNDKTIEFRIFKGSLKYEAIVSAIEFVNALRLFTSSSADVGFDLTTDRFMKFISESNISSETKTLRPYLTERLSRS